MSQHAYYLRDTEDRKEYFDQKFLSYANRIAHANGITLNQFLSRIKDFSSFKQTLKIAWSLDSSLLAYYKGMSDNELRTFFNRPIIQNLLQNRVKEVVQQAPLEVYQQQGKPKSFKTASVKGKRTVAYKDQVTIKGKVIQIYRDSKGRFASIKL